MRELLLIPGRTSQQGVGMNKGKDSPEFLAATTTIEISAEDAAALGLADGDPVWVESDFGAVELTCKVKPAGELPPGVAFIAYGPSSSRLMGGETEGTGMPSASKNLRVRVRPAAREEG